MNKLEKYAKRLLAKMDRLLKKPLAEYKPDTIHKLRVAIKKLNTLFRLLKYSFPDFEEESLFEPFKKIFDQAGTVRECQLEKEKLELVTQNDPPEEYLSSLHDEIDNHMHLFFDELHNAPGKLCEQTYLKTKPYLEKLDKKNISRYIDHQEKSLRKTLKHRLKKNKEIHDLRKQLKNILYVQKLPGFKKSMPVQDIEKIAEQLGQWHDYAVMNKHFEKVLSSDSLPDAEIAKLQQVNNEFSSKRERLIRKVKSELPE